MTVESQQTQPSLTPVLSRYKGEKSELIPVLQDVQEAHGYISREAMSEVATFLNIAESSVYGVVTFYSQFYLSLSGHHKVKVCQGTACHVRGSDKIMKAVTAHLGIGPGETTEDFEFMVERVACFGSCALAPVMVVDDKVYGNMTPEKAVEILDAMI